MAEEQEFAEMIIGGDGTIRHIYDERIDALSRSVGDKDRETVRASHVEPTAELPDSALRYLHAKSYATAHGNLPKSPKAYKNLKELKGLWWADMSPITGKDGPVLGPFQHRSEALTAERDWLNERHLLCERCHDAASATQEDDE